MKKSFKTLVAATTISLFLSLPLQQASGISLFSSSSSDARDTPISVVPEEPEEPVDNRPLSIRLVEAAETHFRSQGFTIRPKLTEYAQKYVDTNGGRSSLTDREELSRMEKESGYCGWGGLITYGLPIQLEQYIYSFKDGTYSTDSFSYGDVGIALSEADSYGKVRFAIWEAEPCLDETLVVES
ncbi:hypothetical protein [Corynebacterium pacaense]|uniref:hypothetical protein n=1 Tax=Corynebacterium pacaense TaxID=1816684 RepID=UPI00117850C1|nr:hypothetical protein [Corynebacterium pacaense]